MIVVSSVTWVFKMIKLRLDCINFWTVKFYETCIIQDKIWIWQHYSLHKEHTSFARCFSGGMFFGENSLKILGVFGVFNGFIESFRHSQTIILHWLEFLEFILNPQTKFFYLWINMRVIILIFFILFTFETKMVNKELDKQSKIMNG